MVKGFISYSHDDIGMCQELHKYLRFLERKHDIPFWVDDKIRAGDRWNQRIGEAIDESHVFLLLCSQNWLSSGYIQAQEVPAIRTRVRQVQGLTIPVVLVKCPWNEELGHFQPVPTRNRRSKAITDWRPIRDGYDQARIEIVEKIKERFNPATRTEDWSDPIAQQVQDESATTWIKIDARFVAETGGGADDDHAAHDPTVRQLHDRLRDRATGLAGLLASPASDPDADAQRRIAAERARDLAETLNTETESVPARIGDLYDSIQMLAISRDGIANARNQRANRPTSLSDAEFVELDALANLATLWIRQFPRAQALDHASVSSRDLPPQAPLAGTIISAGRAARLIEDADAERILALVGTNQTGHAAAASHSLAVLGTRNLLYRVGTFALGFVPDPILPGAWDDRHLADAVRGLLVDHTEALRSFIIGMPVEVREAFEHLIAVAQGHGLRPSTPSAKAAPRPPENPPSDFSLDEVKRRVLAGETIPATWVPFVTKLDLGNSNLRDVTPLAALTALQSLNLRSATVSDVAPLAALTALQSLNLRRTQVSDVAPLGAMTSLQSLDLGRTQVSDVAPLGAMTSLQSLDLGRTQVSDVVPLAALTALQVLDLGYTQANDVTPLGTLTTLQNLNLGGTQVDDVTPLATLTALQRLDLGNTRVSDVTPLGALTALQHVDLGSTKVSDVGSLGGLTALQTLILWGTQVIDLASISELRALQELNLGDTQVTDLAPLRALTALRSLSLGDTPVNDVTPLGVLTALHSLNLSRTQVSDVTPLASLQFLKELDLTGTRTTGVEAVRREGLEIAGGG